VATFFQTSEVLTPDAGAETVQVGSAELTGIFKRQYVELFDDDGERDTLLCATADLPVDEPQGQQVVRQGVTYKVISASFLDPQKTLTQLILQEVS